MEVDRKQKEELLRKVSNLVEQKYFDPEFDVPKWRSLVSARTPAILNGGGAAEFEQQMHDLVSQLGSSHTAFYHRNWRPLPPPVDLCHSAAVRDERWTSLDAAGCSRRWSGARGGSSER